MKRAITFLCICVAFSFASCIDRDFDLADVSGEVTLGGDELVVPIANIEPIYLGDLIEDGEFINSNNEGTYQISYTSYGDDPTKFEKISIDGISIPAITGLSPELEPIGFSFQQLPTTLSMAGVSQTFEVEYPSLGGIVNIQPIEMKEGLNLKLPLEKKQGAINEAALKILKMNGLDVVSSQYASETVFNAEIKILEQLKKVAWVQFGCSKHPYGAPFEVKIDLQGLQDIVGGGNLSVNIAFPEGYYLRDENGEDYPADTHNILARDVVLQPKQKKVEFLVYLNRIDYSDHEFEDGKLKIDDHIKYSYELDLNLCAGSYNLDNMPKFSIEAAPEYKDVEVVINHFEMEGANYAVNYAFDGMPKGVDIERVAFKDTYLTLSLKGLEWLHVMDNLTDEPLPAQLKVTMPECMHFEESSLFANHVLSASADDLSEGIRLKLDYIDCKANGVKQENGQLLIASNIVAEIDLHNMDGHTVLVSSLTPPSTPLAISVEIADAQLKLDTENTKVTWSGDKSFDLDLGDNIPSISQSIEVPEMIASIKEIAIGKAGGAGEPVKIAFKLAGIGKFPVDELEVDVAVNLGKLLRPTQSSIDSGIIKKSDNGDYILVIDQTWSPNGDALAKEVAFEALENIPEIKDGKITLNQNFSVTGSVKIKDGQEIKLVDFGDAKIDIDVKIDDIEVRTFTGCVDLSVKPDEMIVELGDFSDLGVRIDNLALNPIIDIKLKDNPTNIPLNGEVSIKTFNSSGEAQTTIDASVEIKGSGATHLVLSTPRNAAKYKDVEGVQFVQIDGLSDLLADGIPSKIAVNMAVWTDASEARTIDLAQAANGYNIEYQYSLIMPLELESNTKLSFDTTINDLNDIFVELANSAIGGFKVGDIGLIAEFNTDIPLNIVLSAELVDANGDTDGIGVYLELKDCVIEGKKSGSVIDLNLSLGESGSLEVLKNVHGVRLAFSIYGTESDNNALMNSQYLEGKLKLRLRNGLTIDLSELMNGF